MINQTTATPSSSKYAKKGLKWHSENSLTDVREESIQKKLEKKTLRSKKKKDKMCLSLFFTDAWNLTHGVLCNEHFKVLLWYHLNYSICLRPIIQNLKRSECLF